MALKWKMITVGPFAMNAYLLWCDETRAALVIDPGDEIERIVYEIERERLQPERIVLTHGHLDHVMRARELQEQMQLKLYMHREDVFLVENMARQAAMLGLMLPGLVAPRVDGFLAEGDAISFGKQTLKVLHGPGHSPGSIMLLAEDLVVVGDVLFQGSIGRTDLPSGSYETLMDSINKKLLPLKNELLVLPGHGETTTIGEERRSNPFLR
jgi:glyoxylase-like metal-dependent hydrolase (beta-lactamase superfamily II)